jgi:hypothetical protein
MYRLLPGLPNLEHFAIHNKVNADDEPKARFEVSNALASISSKNLKSVSLKYCKYKQAYFENFLQKHAPTLG